MGLENITIKNEVNDRLKESLSTTYEAINKVLNNTAIGSKKLFNNGFVGMSADKVGVFKQALNDYCTKIETELEEIDVEADLTSAIKGDEVITAIKEYIKAIKYLVATYVALLRQEISEINEAYNNFVKTTQSGVAQGVSTLASDVTKTAEPIMAAAKKVDLEGTNVTMGNPSPKK